MTANPNPASQIDMAELLGNAARAHGLNPSNADPIMGPVIAHLFAQVGPVIVDPERTGTQLRWLAAGLDAMARAAELATTVAEDDRWAYQVDEVNHWVEIDGELFAGDGGAVNCTIAVAATDQHRLIAVLEHLTQHNTAYQAWRAGVTPVPRDWNVETHVGVVYAHLATADYPEMPEPHEWLPRPTVWLHLQDAADLLAALTRPVGEDR